MKKLEEIARNVAENKMSEEEAANAVLDVMYRNKPWFGLGTMDMDSFHDFLLYQRSKIIRLLRLYRIDYGNSFTAFFYTSMQQSLRTWKKLVAKNASTEESYALVSKLAYEEQADRYAQAERQLSFESTVPSYGGTMRKNIPALTDKSTVRKGYALLHCNERLNSLRKASCLILALKSSYYLDGDIISKVSKVTGVSEKELTAMVEKLNDAIKSKIRRHERCVRSRDKAFFFHRKYMLECRKLDKGSELKDMTFQKFRKQTATWEARNLMLRKQRYMAVPSNRAVAQLLHMDDRKVGYIMQRAKLNMDRLSQKQYYEEYENLSSDRKSK